MKTKIVFFLLVLFVTNQSFGIGFPHGYTKKKKQETIENFKKENKFEKKIIFVGSALSIIFQKLGTFQR